MMKHADIILGIGLTTVLAIGRLALPQQTPAKEPHRESLPMVLEEPPAPSSLDATESNLRAGLTRNPASADLLYRLALVLRQKSKPRESLEAYTQAAKLLKPDAEQLRSVALDYVLLGDYEDAVHWLRVALTYDPVNVDVLYSLGRCLYTQNRFSDAEESFSRVLLLKPEHLKAEENLGLTYDAENKPEKAEQALRTAATWAEQRHLGDQWPYLNLGAFLLDQARAGDALPYLNKAASIAPNSSICHEKLGRALLATGDQGGGVKELQAAVKLDPTNPKTHFELGRAFRTAGDQEAARAELAISKTLYGAHDQN